jgi:pseudouridine-5'-phosphate glycosidase
VRISPDGLQTRSKQKALRVIVLSAGAASIVELAQVGEMFEVKGMNQLLVKSSEDLRIDYIKIEVAI